MRISEAFDAYRFEYMELRQQSRRTIETHEFVKADLISLFGDIELPDLTLTLIAEWRRKNANKRGLATTRLYVIRVRQVLKHAKLKGELCLDFNLVPVPKRASSVPIFLTAQEVERLIAGGISLRNKFIISLLYSSGIRLSELISLNRGQIRERRFTIVGKGGKARLCFVDERTDLLMHQYLASRKDHELPLIISQYNHRLTATNVQLIIRNAAKRAKLETRVTPHTLRHSFATNFLRNNGNMRYLQQLLGHASIQTTMTYAHVVDADLEDQYRKFHTC